MLNIVIPMAGRGSRFAEAGYLVPKPFIPVGDKPMIEWVVENIRPDSPHRFVFLCLREHLSEYVGMRERLQNIAPGCVIVEVASVTEGAACTVLLAREHIDNGNPLMIANSDQFVDFDIASYIADSERLDLDGLIMTFEANHPKWSYCTLGSEGLVTGVFEKVVVSDKATTGIYNFRQGSDFVRAADAMIAKNARVNGEFYVAPVYNEMINEGALVGIHHLQAGVMHGLGTPEDLLFFLQTDLFKQRASRSAVLRQLSFEYANHFNAKDLAAVMRWFSPDFTLTDPTGYFEGHACIESYISSLFQNHERLSFEVRNVMVDPNTESTAIEFILSLNDQRLIGVDWVEWQGNHMRSLRAYLYGTASF